MVNLKFEQVKIVMIRDASCRESPVHKAEGRSCLSGTCISSRAYKGNEGGSQQSAGMVGLRCKG